MKMKMKLNMKMTKSHIKMTMTMTQCLTICKVHYGGVKRLTKLLNILIFPIPQGPQWSTLL
jgi:hypothetical protein